MRQSKHTGGILSAVMGDDLVIRRATAADADAVHVTLLAAFEPLRARYTPGAFDATVLDPARVAERLGEGPIWVAETAGGVRPRMETQAHEPIAAGVSGL